MHHRTLRTALNTRFIGPSCPFTRTDPNILTLDMCQYSLKGSPWSETMEVWRAQDAIRNALGMRPNYYNGLPQRYRPFSPTRTMVPRPRCALPLMRRSCPLDQ